MEKVLDLAKWNTVQNYAKVKADGIDDVILKAINGSNHIESMFLSHYSGCVNAGINVLATYHYSYARTASIARDCAKVWLSVAKGKCNKYYLDWEDSSLPKSHEAVDIINTYANIIKSAGGDFGVYAGYYWYNTYLKQFSSELPYDFWIARYPSKAIIQDEIDPNIKYKPVISNNLDGWQYTSKCMVDGISTPVDCSIWYEGVHQVNGTDTVEGNPYPEPQRNIKNGTTGFDVKWVQWYLYKFGLLKNSRGVLSDALIDGSFGAQSVSALKIAQKKLGLKPDGICSNLTRQTFKKVC